MTTSAAHALSQALFLYPALISQSLTEAPPLQCCPQRRRREADNTGKGIYLPDTAANTTTTMMGKFRERKTKQDNDNEKPWSAERIQLPQMKSMMK